MGRVTQHTMYRPQDQGISGLVSEFIALFMQCIVEWSGGQVLGKSIIRRYFFSWSLFCCIITHVSELQKEHDNEE